MRLTSRINALLLAGLLVWGAPLSALGASGLEAAGTPEAAAAGSASSLGAAPVSGDGTLNNLYWQIQPQGVQYAFSKGLTDEQIARKNVENLNKALAWAAGSGPEAGLKYSGGKTFVKLERGSYLLDGQHSRVYSVSDRSVSVPSNIDLDLNRSTLMQIPNEKEGYALFTVVGSENVGIGNGTLVGEKDRHRYTGKGTHEFGFGIDVRGGTNIRLVNMDIYNMTGDSIIIGGKDTYLSRGGTISRSVLIDGCRLHDNRRQGITVMGGRDITIENSAIYNIGVSNGTDPRCGIDLENELDWPIENVTIRGNRFYNNSKGAVLVHRGTKYTAIENNTVQGKLVLVYGEHTAIENNDVSDGGIYSVDTSEPVYTVIRNNRLQNASIEIAKNSNTVVTDNKLTGGAIKFNYSTGVIYRNTVANPGKTAAKFGIQVYADQQMPGSFHVYMADNTVSGPYIKQYAVSNTSRLTVTTDPAVVEALASGPADMIDSPDTPIPMGPEPQKKDDTPAVIAGAAALALLSAAAVFYKKKKRP
ncbi:MAG TPA: right-handed parallel beta-helix repeat-containing protein [Feifaniaceae bacterium]|nr:right-handed parallel beta-helix repeat-containing protein [Feifaniaceae bacterium]